MYKNLSEKELEFINGGEFYEGIGGGASFDLMGSILQYEHERRYRRKRRRTTAIRRRRKYPLPSLCI